MLSTPSVWSQIFANDEYWNTVVSGVVVMVFNMNGKKYYGYPRKIIPYHTFFFGTGGIKFQEPHQIVSTTLW